MVDVLTSLAIALLIALQSNPSEHANGVFHGLVGNGTALRAFVAVVRGLEPTVVPD